jgi:hypothetical protein
MQRIMHPAMHPAIQPVIQPVMQDPKPQTIQELTDLQSEQLSGGRWYRARAAAPCWRRGPGRPRFFGGGRGFLVQSILNKVNQINIAFNIAIGGGSVFNHQGNALTMQSSL